MAYNPTVWEENDLLSIDRMNKIENGIAAASSPTAQTISFDPQETGLTAENVQDAIVEVYESSGVEIASDAEVGEMLNDVFGAPFSNSFEELYGVTLSEDGDWVTFECVGCGIDMETSLSLSSGVEVTSVVTRLNKRLANHNGTAHIDSSSGYIVVTDNETGEEVSLTISKDGTQYYPAS